jgi:hypothetical protein
LVERSLIKYFLVIIGHYMAVVIIEKIFAMYLRSVVTKIVKNLNVIVDIIDNNLRAGFPCARNQGRARIYFLCKKTGIPGCTRFKFRFEVVSPRQTSITPMSLVPRIYVMETSAKLTLSARLIFTSSWT